MQIKFCVIKVLVAYIGASCMICSIILKPKFIFKRITATYEQLEAGLAANTPPKTTKNAIAYIRNKVFILANCMIS